MQLLLDTHVLLWALAEPERLSLTLEAQALTEPARLLTVDARLAQCSELVEVIG